MHPAACETGPEETLLCSTVNVNVCRRKFWRAERYMIFCSSSEVGKTDDSTGVVPRRNNAQGYNRDWAKR